MKILNPLEINIDFVITEIKKGKVFIMPTDTSYGMVGGINKKTIKKIEKIKKRIHGKYMPIFVSQKWIKHFVEINNSTKKLINSFWPGALTLVVKPKKDKIFTLSGVLSPERKIAIREPKEKLLLAILQKYKKPLTATSANISGKPACYSVKEILKQFDSLKHQPDYIIDGGALPKRPASTIMDTETLNIIRTGKITKNAMT